MDFTILMLILLATTQAEIIDYTRSNYVLIETGGALVYENTSSIFHVANLTYIQDFLDRTKESLEIKYKRTTYPDSLPDRKHEEDFNIIQTLLDQLMVSRSKRAIETIGTIWKWIAGTPDHDDEITIENKINDLVANNNRQFTINSKLFEAINSIKHTVKDELISKKCKFIIFELQNLINTLTLAKLKLLNPAILNIEDMNKIVKNEIIETFTLTDLMDISEFKILQKEGIIVIYIKYPVIYENCTLYETRAISQNDGKLVLSKEIVKCNKKFRNIEKCNLEIRHTFCKIARNSSCLSNLLNGKKATCDKIKERNLEIIKDGSILVSGKHEVNNETLEGTYLINFEDNVTIGGRSYDNPTHLIQNYLKTHLLDRYDINQYLESLDKRLKIDNTNLLEKLRTETTKSPIFTISTLSLLAIIIIIIAILRYRNRKPRPSRNVAFVFTFKSIFK